MEKVAPPAAKAQSRSAADAVAAPRKRAAAAGAGAATGKKRSREAAVGATAGKKKRRAAAGAGKKRSASRVTASPRWTSNIPLTVKAMVLAGEVLFVAGTPVAFPANDLAKAYEGRMGGVLWAASAKTGEKLAEYKLDAPPAWDGMAVANARLYIALQGGRVVCLAAK